MCIPLTYHNMSEARKAEIRQKLNFSFGQVNATTAINFVFTCGSLTEANSLDAFLKSEFPALCEKFHVRAVTQLEIKDGYRIVVAAQRN